MALEVCTVSALMATAQTLMAHGKGLLAMDESVGTCSRPASWSVSKWTPVPKAWRAILASRSLKAWTGCGND